MKGEGNVSTVREVKLCAPGPGAAPTMSPHPSRASWICWEGARSAESKVVGKRLNFFLVLSPPPSTLDLSASG